MRNKIICGHVLDILKTLPDCLVDCIVASPPYWGLRDYGVKGQLGLEPTLDEYIDNLVEVFHEAHRVLKDEGTLWLNMGDGYCAGTSAKRTESSNAGVGRWQREAAVGGVGRVNVASLKPKDLIGQPWRIAFALQADGWYLRSDIIWAKPNPMPESVSGTGYYRHKIRQIVDGKKEWVECPGCEKCNPHGGYVLRWNAGRPTKSHEYIFLLSKSAEYYYDAEAVKEPGQDWGQRNRQHSSYVANKVHLGSPQTICTGKHDCKYAEKGRNKRTVWTVATQPFPEAHFATFPEKLIEPCIRAGTSEKGYCAECGKPWVRVIKREFVHQQDVNLRKGIRGQGNQKPMDDSNTWQGFPRGQTQSTTVDWQPSCSCGADIVPGLVCDPFGGSGTVALESKKLGRDYLIRECGIKWGCLREPCQFI